MASIVADVVMLLFSFNFIHRFLIDYRWSQIALGRVVASFVIFSSLDNCVSIDG